MTSPHAELYVRNVLTPADAARFVCRLFDELVRTNVQYDVVTSAIERSGIAPRPSVECRGEFFEIRQERVNTLADALFAKLRASVSVRAAVTMVARQVLETYTSPAPRPHLTPGELEDYLLCSLSAMEDHAGCYDLYAAQHAHVGSCAHCNNRVVQLAERRA